MTHSPYRRVNPSVSFPELERRILEDWQTERVFERSLERRADAPEWVFYEGPPTANGRPGIHHVEARALKDVFCRFQTMRGRFVPRKAGWDCHGLPVELEVEKQLGIRRKRQIEDEVGIERFVRLCRESVTRYVDEWVPLTARIGFWVDFEDAYWTMSPEYIETVWWLLRQIWDKGLLQEDFRVVPYCPRCETALSSHEQHYPGAYEHVTDPSVYVRFPLVDDPASALLVWTTTPWTLLANMAVAVGPEIPYARVADPYEPEHSIIVARDLVDALFGGRARVLETLQGSALVGREYTPPFPYAPGDERGHRVFAGDFVSTEEGTGIVHLAPYGEEDMNVAKREGLPIHQVIDPSGRVVAGTGHLAGMWFKDVDERVVADLESSGRLWRAELIEHSYPHCWRCGTPLLYYPHRDWYIRTSQMRNDLEAANESTNWQPPSVKHGRFGDWLANNVDWSLSRDRYWGTPLPIWRCGNGHAVCVGSFGELGELAHSDLEGFDPHRPYVDDITFACPSCGDRATRVRSVIDVWFDSGAMPFAQWHYPFENEDVFERRFPADFISEAIDQTRGWFYSLLAEATLVRGENSYRNVVCLGLIIDEGGRKMSKSLGNVLDPWTVLDSQGADALRWYMLTGGTPWSARRISEAIVRETLRRYLLTLWNTYSFWVQYASLEGFDPTTEQTAVDARPELDRWILAELDDAVRVVTEGLERFDATAAGRRIERFVDDLSNWYVRRSRRRFWRSKEEADTRAAFLTLWECLVTVAQLSAPFTPFLADEIFTNVTSPDPGAPDSVHLADWPQPDDRRVNSRLRTRMRLVRKLVALGRAARTDAGVKVRQPLARALVVLPAGEAGDLEGLESIMAEELNVRAVELARGLEDLVSYELKPNFRALGPRLGARVKDVAHALAEVDAAGIVERLERGEMVEIRLEGDVVALRAEDLDVRVEGRAGFTLAREGPYGVALDLDIDDELRAEGVARETVRAVQDLRKSSGLAVEDRVELWLDASDPGARAALDRHEAYIAGEVLAATVHVGDGAPDGTATDALELPGATISLALRRLG